jgi:hypothetical protein
MFDCWMGWDATYAIRLLERIAGDTIVANDAIPGTDPALLDTPVGPLSVAISWEIFFADERAVPLAVALHAVRKQAAPGGEPVLVVGCGPIGGFVALLLSRLHDGTVLLVRLNDGAEILARARDDVPVSALAWDARGATLAFATEQGAGGLLTL